MSKPVITQNGSPGIHKQRTEIMNELRRLDWEFVREPTITRAKQLRELRDHLSDIEERLVKEIVNSKLFAMLMEDEANKLVTIGMLEDEDA